MSFRLLLIACLAGLSPVVAAGQQPTLVVENGRVVVGDGTVLERGSVVIAGDRIVSITEEPVEAPGARRIDAAGKTVMAGLIDTHVHLLMEKLFEQPRTDSAMRRFLEEQLPGRLSAYTEAGITTVMSAGDYWPFIREVARRLEAGELSGPRLYMAGPLITAPEGHPAATFCGFLDVGGPNPWCREHLTVEVATAAEARRAVERLAGGGEDLVKLVYEESPATAPLRPELVAEVVEAAHRADLRAYGHILEPAKATEAVTMGLDGLVHLPAAASGDTTGLMALVEAMHSHGVGASTTLVIFDAFRTIAEDQGDEALAHRMADRLDGMRRTLRRLSAAGGATVPIALGTDAPHLPPAEAYQREIGLLAEAGLTARQVLRAATSDASRYLGRAEQLGTLEAGKLADLIVVDGNPLEDLSALQEVDVVVRGGKVVS